MAWARVVELHPSLQCWNCLSTTSTIFAIVAASNKQKGQLWLRFAHL